VPIPEVAPYSITLSGNNCIWNAQAKRCCRFEVYGKFESDRLFDREFGWACSLEDFVDVLRGFDIGAVLGP
jgi:hypothetical protein